MARIGPAHSRRWTTGHRVRYVHDGADSAAREQWASEVLDTSLFYAASRFKVIEEASRAEALVSGTVLSFPEPPTWLEIFETDQQDPLTAYRRTLEALADSRRAAEIQQSRAPVPSSSTRATRPLTEAA